MPLWAATEKVVRTSRRYRHIGACVFVALPFVKLGGLHERLPESSGF